MSENKPKILVVDNDVEICNLFKDFFDFIGYESTLENDGVKALRELDKMEYDVLFVDLKLDTISGVEIIKKSKEVNPLSEVIVVTGFGSEETVLKTLQYGASLYLQKPISFSDIKFQTEEALANLRFNIKTEQIKRAIQSKERSLSKHLDQIINLDRFSKFLNLTIDIELLGISILNGIAQILPGTYFSFFFYDAMNKEMALYASTPFSDEIAKSLEGKVKSAFEGYTNKKVEVPYNVRISQINDTNNKGSSKPFSEMSHIFVPIIISNAVCSVLGISGDPKDLCIDVEDMLELLSTRVARVLNNATLHREAKMLAITDGLTGLLNHRAFDERLKQEFERFIRYGSYLSLIVADFDNLKAFNDTYGHPMGDEMLRKVGEILIETSRDSDVLARYGGDEFVILLPQTNVDNALNMAERIRLKINNNIFTFHGNQIKSSISMGISTAPQLGIETSHNLFESADSALYKAKRTGKNCIAVANHSH